MNFSKNKLNRGFANLQGNYLFAEIARRLDSYRESHPDHKLIRLGIGDVTRPLAPSVIAAMHRAVDEMAGARTFHGYGPERGYEFLREAIVRAEYETRGVSMSPDEIFVSDGSKCDVANFQELFSSSCRVALGDPVYPVYLDSNVMANRSGKLQNNGHYERVAYLPFTAENSFAPPPPSEKVDLIYLCSPNNPTGTALDRETLSEYVAYAHRNHALILFDSAYSAYIRDPKYPGSIYEIPGAREVAVEFKSFSKTAGFTGMRCAFTVVPRELGEIHDRWFRRCCTKFNGVSYVVQRAAEAACSETGRTEIQRDIAYYMGNAAIIAFGLRKSGYEFYGGEHAPYLWWRLPDGVNSFDFFDRLLTCCEIVGTPGSGFGPRGEGYFRLTAFGDRADTEEAMRRIAERL